MTTQTSSNLFSELSEQDTSATKGGWYGYGYGGVTVVVSRPYQSFQPIVYQPRPVVYQQPVYTPYIPPYGGYRPSYGGGSVNIAGGLNNSGGGIINGAFNGYR